MFRFLKYLLIFLLPIILVAVVAECYMRNLPNEYAFKDQWMRENGKSVETLVIGSSKGYYGVRPQLLSSKAFNLSTISERPDYDCFLLEKFVDSCPKLKTIIYPVFYEMFVDPPFEECEEWPRATYFKLYMDCPYHSGLSKYAFEISSITAIGEKYRNYKDDGGLGCDSLGYGLHCKLRNPDMSESDWDEEAINAALRHTNPESEYKAYNYEYVSRFADICNKKCLNLILVSFPCYNKYVERFDKSQLDDFYKRINDVKTKYGAKFFDFMNDPRFVYDDFYDSNHLSQAGADKFTIILDSIINSYKK